ncbi:hypothetical protein BEK98_45075 [Streptomyces diastatochromogenes]|uniref:Uncharacterized protein n=1 Tax=Streptomyces diastatochromogenes TaxID=42236 RepID=A0A233RRL2_STRDA|nr:hypothetical protein BEK98_45075 [Streptomyces diastatochromogenes]
MSPAGGAPAPGCGLLRPRLLFLLFLLQLLRLLRLFLLLFFPFGLFFLVLGPCLFLFRFVLLLVFLYFFLLAADAGGPFVQDVREVCEFAVGRGGESLAARILEFAAQLVVEVGDLRQLLKLAEPFGEQLLGLEAETAAREIGGQSEGEAPLLRTAEDIATGDCGSESDLRRIVHRSFPPASRCALARRHAAAGGPSRRTFKTHMVK